MDPRQISQSWPHVFFSAIYSIQSNFSAISLIDLFFFN